MMRSEGEAAKSRRPLTRWLLLGPFLTVAVLGFVFLLLIYATLFWSSTSGGGWIYLTIPAASLTISVGGAVVAFLATKRSWPTALAGTLALLACDLAAGIVLLQEPFLF